MEKKYVDFEKGIHALHQAVDPIIKTRGEELLFVRCMEAYRSIPAADVTPVQRWISVKERLPDASGRYLAMLKRDGDVGFELNDFEQRIMKFTTENGWRYPSHSPKWINDALVQEVTHWMPIPDPPAD